MPRSGGTLLYNLQEGNKRGFARSQVRHGVVKSELCQPWMIKRIKEGKARAIGSIRDIRDIIVSLQGFYNRREIAKNSIARYSIIEVVKGDLPRVLEDFYKWNEVCERWYRYETELFGLYDMPVIDQDIWIDSKTLYTQKHTSSAKGESRWQEMMTQREIEMVNRIAGDWLKEYGYQV